MSEMMPRTATAVGTGWPLALSVTDKVETGLVPISPNTTPVAVSASNQGLALWRSSPPRDGSAPNRAEVTLRVEAFTGLSPWPKTKTLQRSGPRIASSFAAAGGRRLESHDQLSAPPALRLALSARNLCGDRLFPCWSRSRASLSALPRPGLDRKSSSVCDPFGPAEFWGDRGRPAPRRDPTQ